ncbi:class I SAM-dependent methyltransferase [Leptolyngbya sp. FACHB-261]|nr:class I SAM-dependent methyltransferase [Leptolyngbya sp. FACHB-261]
MADLLSNQDVQRLDESADPQFYSFPRFVTHVDDGFIDQLTRLYAERIPADSRVLDLMSSWVSHLPDASELPLREVVGHGLNAEELGRNPSLAKFVVQDLNKNPRLSFEDQSFDAILIAVSIQYVTRPLELFQELQRLLTPGGVVITSFSNRMFHQKAIRVWMESNETERVELVKRYFQNAGGFERIEAVQNQGRSSGPLGWLLPAGDPFYAVLGYKTALAE